MFPTHNISFTLVSLTLYPSTIGCAILKRPLSPWTLSVWLITHCWAIQKFASCSKQISKQVISYSYLHWSYIQHHRKISINTIFLPAEVQPSFESIRFRNQLFAFEVVFWNAHTAYNPPTAIVSIEICNKRS